MAEGGKIKKDFAICIRPQYRWRVSELEYPDQHHLRAAHGWLELGRPREAGEELDRISAGNFFQSDVLEARWNIAVENNDWHAALQIARDLIDVDPDRASGWIDQSYCLHELKRTQEAWERLLPAAGKFSKASIIPYNLACYACQLGRLEPAQEWLAKAMALGDATQVKAMALNDADLQPLWSVIEKL